MENQSHETEFGMILDEMRNLYERKNKDYGSSFTESIDEWGYQAALIRMQDKMRRLKQLLVLRHDAAVEDEKAEDTAIDLANYAVMLVQEIRSKKEIRKAKMRNVVEVYGVSSSNGDIPEYNVGV